MKSLTDTFRCARPSGPFHSTNEVESAQGIHRPYSIRWLIQFLEEVVVEKPVVTPDGDALGGHVKFMLRGDGAWRFTGYMRATGYFSYHYRLQVFAGSPGGSIVAAQATGYVSGTDGVGRREIDWIEEGSSQQLRDEWASVWRSAQIWFRLDASVSGLAGELWKVLQTVGETSAIGWTLGTAGVAVFLGAELADSAGVTTDPGVLAGVMVAGGMVLVFGPGVIIPSVVAGVAVNSLLDIQSRAIKPEEIAFADRVFRGTIDYSRIRITNLTHGGGHKYTIPSLDSRTILVNLGPAYDDPMTFADTEPNSDYSQPGSVFIHELVHAWQICRSKFLPGLLCKYLSAPDRYSYHPGDLSVYGSESNRMTYRDWASLPWDTYKLEQQAHIVDDWYGANYLDLNSSAAINDPAFHFIRDNIRAPTND